MAQTALSGSDLSLIRGYQSIPSLHMYITPLTLVASGLITAVSDKYPTVQLTMTWFGGDSDVVVGQYYQVLDSGVAVAHGIIRKAVSGNTCYINETPLGSYGFATNVESAIETGMILIIYSHHPMFSLNSRIASKTFYKYWDVSYSGQNENAFPVANAGTWQAAHIAPDESTARFTLPRSGENISFLLGIEDDIDYQWTLPSGVSLVSGYADTDAVIEVDAIPGDYQISLTASYGGDEHTAYLWLFVSRDGTIRLDQQLALEINSDTQNLLGREMEFTATGTNIEDILYDGAGILFKCNSSYNGESLSTGVEVDTFVGYITELRVSHDGNIGRASFKVVSPLILAQQIGQPSQSLTQVANPANWNQMDSERANVRFFTYYLIKWTCPALLDMHDLDIPFAFEGTKRKYLEVNGKDLASNLQTVADYMLSNFGSASDGSSVMRLKPQYLNNSDRNALEVIWEILDTDIKAPLEYIKRMYNPLSDVRGGAFAFSSGKPKAFYAGRRWAQGSGSSELPGFIVPPSGGETRVKEVVGHYMAEQNAAIQEIALDLTMNQDVIEPVYMQWYKLTVDSRYDPLGNGFDEQRLFATEITREWDFGDAIKKRIRLIGQPETYGQAGEILPIANVKGLSKQGYSIGFPQPWTPNASGGMFGGAASILLALNEDGLGAISFDYSNPNPSWASLNNAVNNVAINDWDFDWGSEYFANGGDSTKALGLYAVTVTAAVASIWYYPDILRGYNASVLQTYSLSDSTIDTEARIKCSETYPDLVIAVFKDGTGTRYGRSTNGGGTWGSLTRVGSAISDVADNDNRPIGLAVYGQYQFLSAPDGSADYGVYRATTAAGSFSLLSGSQLSRQPIPMIIEGIESNNCLFVTQIEGGRYSNNFDGSDYMSFAGRIPVDSSTPPCFQFARGTGSNWQSDGIVSGGHSGNCYQFSASSLSGTAAQRELLLHVDVSNLGSGVIYDFFFDVKWQSPNSANPLRLNIGEETSLDGQGTWHRVHVSDYASWTGDYPLSTYLAIMTITSELATPAYIWIDNLILLVGDGYNLWRVDSATGSASWVAVDPASNRAPARPFGLNVNLINQDKVNFVSQFTEDWYSSSNNGSSWTNRDSTSDFRTFYTNGNNMLAGGVAVIQISYDDGDSFSDISGNLSNLWDGIGTIKKVLAL